MADEDGKGESKSMKKLICTKDMKTEEWLEYRRRGIGGSDASVILGISPYRSILQLWEEKTGRVSIEEKKNSYTYFGHVMEPVIKKEFTKRTGLKVRAKNYMLQSEEHPFMLADLDGVVREKDGSYSVFEAKTASEYKKPVWEKGVPEEYVAQVQHYLCVTGYQKAYVCAVVGGNTYYCYQIKRNGEYMKNLVEKEKAFWDCVKKGIPPKPDGSKMTTDYLNRIYPKCSKKEMELPEKAEKLVESYLEMEDILKELGTRKNQIANELKGMLKEHEKGYAGNHVVNWTTVVKRSLDSGKVKKMLGAAYKDCLTESQYRKFSIA